MGSLGYFDPDENELDLASSIVKKPAPRTNLQRLVLESCGRKTFTDPRERAAWRKIEEMAIGADQDSMLNAEWIRFCARVWKKANTPIPTRSFKNLAKYIQNTEKRQEWILNNKKRLLEERARRMIDEAGV